MRRCSDGVAGRTKKRSTAWCSLPPDIEIWRWRRERCLQRGAFISNGRPPIRWMCLVRCPYSYPIRCLRRPGFWNLLRSFPLLQTRCWPKSKKPTQVFLRKIQKSTPPRIRLLRHPGATLRRKVIFLLPPARIWLTSVRCIPACAPCIHPRPMPIEPDIFLTCWIRNFRHCKLLWTL